MTSPLNTNKDRLLNDIRYYRIFMKYSIIVGHLIGAELLYNSVCHDITMSRDFSLLESKLKIL